MKEQVYLHAYHIANPTYVISRKKFSDYMKRFYYPIYPAEIDKPVEAEVIKTRCPYCDTRDIELYILPEILRYDAPMLKGKRFMRILTSCGCDEQEEESYINRTYGLQSLER